MRNFFKEGDIISAEVMQINSSDGRIQLQTRNLKYGKLLNGFMVKTDSNYVRRMKNHILEFFQERKEFSIGCIIGTNGYIWIYSPNTNQLKVNKNNDPVQAVIKSVSMEKRECMAILRNVIACLQRDQLPIFKDTIQLVIDKYFELEQSQTIKSKHILQLPSEIICEKAKNLIEQEIQNNMKSFDMQRIMD